MDVRAVWREAFGVLRYGGQLDAGFVLTGMYEDRHSDFAPARYIPTYLATCAVKLEPGVAGREGMPDTRSFR